MSGMDLILAFIREVLDEDAAEAVQFGTEYYPEGIIYGQPGKRTGAPAYLRREIKRREGG